MKRNTRSDYDINQPENGEAHTNQELIVDWGLNWGLRCVPCSTLQSLGCHPCACKLFCINFPLNS
jgi:hypothetical protein